MAELTKQPGRPQDPSRLDIQPGLDHLPRQIGIFPAFRAAMLEHASTEMGLGGSRWLGRDVDDYGVMLIEMWAYVCDVISFYDSWAAGESYLRTAMRTAAAHRLADLIGYIPRPAVAAVVDLALSLDGRKPVTLPAGTAFRSGAFDAEKPQVFTLLEAVTRHPLRSKFTLRPQPKATLSASTVSSLTFRRGSVGVKAGDAVAVKVGSSYAASSVSTVEDISDAAGNPVTKVTFASSLSLPASAQFAQMSLLHGISPQSVHGILWTYISSGSSGGTGYTYYTYMVDKFVLDGQVKSIKPGHLILIRRDHHVRWFKVKSVRHDYQKLVTASKTISSTSDGKTTTTTIPAIYQPVTEVTLDADLGDNAHHSPQDTGSWTFSDVNGYTFYAATTPAGTGLGEAEAALSASDVLRVNEKVTAVDDDYEPDQFILKDLGERAVMVDGALADNGTLTIGASSAWTGDLVPPVTVYGALARATRGEKVSNEILGFGDASQPNQTFKLKKKPLTYLNAATDSGVQSTLEIYVDGIKWREVTRFYNRRPDEAVFIIRQTVDGDSEVIFGDGVHGARPSSGAQIVAHYQYGAGAAAPPAGSISQIVTPVAGVTSITNPLPAFGGADAEDEAGIKRYAPRSAMMLGRAVSLVDYEAVAAGTSGVTRARATWRWSQTQQRPVVTIHYIGEGSISALISERLAGYSAEGVPFEIIAAQPVAKVISLAIVVDPDYVIEDVSADVIDVLVGENGALLPENLGIGARLIRSRVLALVAGVPGVIAPQSIAIDGVPMATPSINPGVGGYFVFTVSVSAQFAS